MLERKYRERTPAFEALVSGRPKYCEGLEDLLEVIPTALAAKPVTWNSALALPFQNCRGADPKASGDFLFRNERFGKNGWIVHSTQIEVAR
jgi:hypothetical protein